MAGWGQIFSSSNSSERDELDLRHVRKSQVDATLVRLFLKEPLKVEEEGIPQDELSQCGGDEQSCMTLQEKSSPRSQDSPWNFPV